MITQWDIISAISPKNNAILYTLLIDGTEHDARLIGKKLQGYVQAPKPALAPYVYRFELPEDLDEDTLEKIRVAVREGIETAKKVNEFVPGGSLGNPLFNADTDKEDKNFPTFITLDPSESFFRQARTMPPAPPMPAPEVDAFERKSIDLSDLEEEALPPAPTSREETPDAFRPEPPQTPVPPADMQTEKQEVPVAGLQPPAPEAEEEPAEMLTSVESQDQDWSDQPPEEPTAAQQPKVSPAQEKDDAVTPPPPQMPEAPHSEREDIGLQVQAVAAQELPEELSPAAPRPDGAENQTDLPLTDRDMLIKDMEGTMLGGQVLDDILLAETKYDMFVDFDQLAPKTQQAGGTKDQPIPPAAPEQSARPDEAEDGGFNIFDQKIKDQTCFIDLEDVSGITERITQKDLDFVKHAQVNAQQSPASAAAKPAQPVPHAAMGPFGRFDMQQDDKQEVLDPFEQLLAASSAKEEAPRPAPEQMQPEKPEQTDGVQPPQTPVSQAEETPQTRQTQQEPQTAPAQTLPAAEALSSGNTERENRVVPPPTAPITEKKMTEQQGDKKPILRIKRKAEAQAPAAPRPPQAPLAPQAPQPAAPNTPAEVSNATARPVPPPQEEVHHTVLRRRRPASTFLEKTRTIDHSIELPLSELKKHNWPLEVPLIPTYTLENMTISINRFAHATAISVIDNPGKLYNPLVLHGASGTGKTHFLHAIGYALSKKYGQENIFITNGVRLSRGIQRYVMEGNMDKFEEFVSSVKALLIDDLHLVAINEQNRAHLSKLLNDFRAQGKQIVVTSKYPPESLAKMEELLNFKLDSGWISDLKQASGPARTRIIQQMLRSNGINISDEDVNRFFGHANMSLGTVSRAIRRVRVLEKLIFPTMPEQERSASAIFDQLLATKGEDQNSLIAQKSVNEVNSAPVNGNGEWGRIGFFYPQNHSNMMNWLVFALQQRAKELGITGGPELAVRSSYSTENIISSAFKIANLCDNKKLKGAVILGPSMDVCEPSVRENFYDILTHMLEIMLIRCGVINYEDAGSPSTYVKILSELLR